MLKVLSLLLVSVIMLNSLALAQQTPATGYYAPVQPGSGQTPATGYVPPAAPAGSGQTPATGYVPGGGITPPASPTAPTSSPRPQARPTGAASQEDIVEAVQAYVTPTSTRFFSLSNLNSDREASLVISSGNEENNVIFRVIRLIAMLVGTVAIILYIVAGYYMIFSRGEENELTKGKQIITFTSLGLVIAFGAYMIVQLVMGLIYFSS